MQRCKRSTSAWSESEDEMTRCWWRQGELTTSGDRSDARRKNNLWWRIIDLFILLRACIFVDFNAWPVSAWLHHQRQIHSCKSTDRKMVNKYCHRRFWNEKLRKVCILFIFLRTLPFIQLLFQTYHLDIFPANKVSGFAGKLSIYKNFPLVLRKFLSFSKIFVI